MKIFGRSSTTDTGQAASPTGNGTRTGASRSNAKRSIGNMFSKLTNFGSTSGNSSSRTGNNAQRRQPAAQFVSTAESRGATSRRSDDEDISVKVARIVSQKSLHRDGDRAGSSSTAEPQPTLAHFIAPDLGISPEGPAPRKRHGFSRFFARSRAPSSQAPNVPVRNEQPPVSPQISIPREDPIGELVGWLNDGRIAAAPPMNITANEQSESSRESHASHASNVSNASDASDASDASNLSDVSRKSQTSNTQPTQHDTDRPVFDEADGDDDGVRIDLDLGEIHTPPAALQAENDRITQATPSESSASHRSESGSHDIHVGTATPEPPPEDPGTSVTARRTGLGKLKEALNGLRKHAADEAYVHGFGISSTSLSLTPFSTNTRTARAKPFTGVVREGDAAIESHKRLADLPGGTPPAVLHESAVVKGLEHKHALDELFLDESFLPGTDRRQLIDSIKQAAEDKQLTPLETTSLAQALHIAFARTPDRPRDTAYDPAYDAAHDARAALQSLPQTNLLDALRDNAEPVQRADYDADRAWALAQELVHIPGGVGASLLEKLTPQTARPAGTHASVVEKDRMLVGVLLKASQQAVREARYSAGEKKDGKVFGVFSRPSRQVGNAQSPSPDGPRMLAHDPASIFADGALHVAIAEAGEGNWPGRGNTPVPSGLSLAQKAMLAVKEELAEIDAHVAGDTTRGTAFNKGTHGCRFAISMIRGDMLTDQTREPSGAHSQFGLAEARLGKSVGKHLDRAMRRPAAWNNFVGSLKELGRYVGVYKNKSPFNTYNRLAESDGGRGMDVGNRGGTHVGRAFRDMIDKVEATIDERPTLAQDAAGGDEQALRLLVRSSIMKTTKAETVMLPRFAQPGVLTDLSQEKVAGDVAAKLASSGTAPDEATHAKIAAMVAEENQPLTAQKLGQWAAAVGGPADADALKEIASNTAADHPWRAFAQSFEHAENPSGVASIDTPSLRGKSREEVADILAKIVAAEELGSGFAFDSAGNVQGTTKNVSGLISRAAMHFIGSVHLDLGGGKIRTVRFESLTSTDRSQLRVSVTTLKRGQAGVGGTVGHFTGHDHPVTLGGGMDVGGAYEVVHQEGAVLGFPRNLSGGVLGDRALNEKKGQLVKLLVLGGELEGHAQPANEEDRKSLIKSAYQAFGDDLSIGFYEMDQSDTQGTLSVNGSAGVRFDHFKLSTPTLGASGKAQGTTIRYRDQSGFLKTEWKTDSSSYNASFQASLAGLNGYDEIPTDPGDPGASVMTSVAPFLSGSAQFFRFGVADRHVQIMQDGKELATSFATRTFQAPISFLHEFGQSVDKYADEKAKKYFGDEYGKGGRVRENLVAREKARMLEFVDHYLKQRDLTATPQLYTEFGDNVDIANKLRAAAYMADRMGDKDTAKAARQEIDAIHSDQKYREGRFLTNLQVQQDGRQVGVNGIAGLTYSRNDNRAQQVLTFT